MYIDILIWKETYITRRNRFNIIILKTLVYTSIGTKNYIRFHN